MPYYTEKVLLHCFDYFDFLRREHLSQEDLRKNRELNKAFSSGRIPLDNSSDDEYEVNFVLY